MTTLQLAAQARFAGVVDRLMWGLMDLRDRLIASGWWPTLGSLVVDTAGARWLVRGERAVATRGSQTARGVALDAEDCLWGSLRLPAMSRRALATAVGEALWHQAPLAPEQMVSAWRAQPETGGGWQVVWGMAPRQRLDDARQAAGLGADAPAFLLREGRALIVRDAVSARRERWQRALDIAGLLSIALALAAAAVLAAMPALLKRQGVVDARQALQQLEPRAAPVRQQLDALRLQAQLLEAVRSGQADAVPAASVIEALTAVLPDDTMLDRVDVNGRDIRISGLTPNAADLLSRIAQDTAFSDAKAANAAVRDNASGKERFTFELRWKGVSAS